MPEGHTARSWAVQGGEAKPGALPLLLFQGHVFGVLWVHSLSAILKHENKN